MIHYAYYCCHFCYFSSHSNNKTNIYILDWMSALLSWLSGKLCPDGLCYPVFESAKQE
jgi:hypothetical protein